MAMKTTLVQISLFALRFVKDQPLSQHLDGGQRPLA